MKIIVVTEVRADIKLFQATQAIKAMQVTEDTKVILTIHNIK